MSDSNKKSGEPPLLRLLGRERLRPGLPTEARQRHQTQDPVLRRLLFR